MAHRFGYLASKAAPLLQEPASENCKPLGRNGFNDPLGVGQLKAKIKQGLCGEAQGLRVHKTHAPVSLVWQPGSHCLAIRFFIAPACSLVWFK